MRRLIFSLAGLIVLFSTQTFAAGGVVKDSAGTAPDRYVSLL